MTLQYLQPGVAQPAERPSSVGVIGITIGASDLGGSLLFLSLALTNFLPKLLVFFRLIQGLGIWFSCSTVVFRLFLIVFKSSPGAPEQARQTRQLPDQYSYAYSKLLCFPPVQPCLGATSSVHYKQKINCKHMRDSN